VCSDTAIGCDFAGEEALSVMERAIGLKREKGEYLYRWNDVPGRTQNEVLAAFDKAIAIAKVEP
jgi:hypothetical protein